MKGMLGLALIKLGTSELPVSCELSGSTIGIPAHRGLAGILMWISQAQDKGLRADK